MKHAQGAGPNVLVVLLAEPNKQKISIIQDSFAGLGILDRLMVVTNGEEVLSYLRGDGSYADRVAYPFPNVVFMASRLPLLSGLTVLCCLRSESRFENLPVVVLDDAISIAQAETATRMRAACCTKAGSPSRLIEAIAKSVRLAVRLESDFSPSPVSALT